MNCSFFIFFLVLAEFLISCEDVRARDYVPLDQTEGMRAPVASGKHGAASGLSRPSPGAATPGQRAPKTSAGAQASPSRLFGTVEFQRPLNSLPGWLDVLRRNGREPIFQDSRHFTKTVTWQKLRAAVSGKSPIDQLRHINSFWNGWPYMEDSANWGESDYWAIPAQFLKKSGDCEDYAIAKYFTLKELGFPPDKMRLVILRDTVRNLPHAILAVYLDNEVYVLDNLSNVVLSHSRLGNYDPQYSVNEFGRWAHIRPKQKRR